MVSTGNRSELFDLGLALKPNFTNDELRDLFLAHQDYDYNYLAIHARPDFLKVKEYFQKSWETFEAIADRNFKSEFRTSAFHERAWELLLNKVFTDKGLVPEPTKNGGRILKSLYKTNIYGLRPSMPKREAERMR